MNNKLINTQNLAVNTNQKRGVSSHSDDGVSIYEKLVHPEGDKRKEIAKDLKKELDEKFKNNWKIFEPGIGGGWLTLKLLELIVSAWEKNNNFKLELWGVDTCDKMLNYFLKSLPFKSNLDDFQNISFPFIKTYNTSLEIRLYNSEAIEFIKKEMPQGSKFNIIFCFFLLHHLDDWEEGLKHIVSVLDKDGIIVISEVQGDQAAWSASFDKIYGINNNDISTLEDRLEYIRFIRIFQEKCEEINWYNYMPVTASTVDTALEWLENNGFKHVKTISKEYEKSITLLNWLKAGGIKPIKNGEYERIFSVFPTFDKDDKRTNFEKELISKYNNNTENEFTKIISKKVKIKDKLVYYILSKD